MADRRCADQPANREDLSVSFVEVSRTIVELRSRKNGRALEPRARKELEKKYPYVSP
jgi:hypothetical protein